METKYINSLTDFIINLSKNDLKKDKFELFNMWSKSKGFTIKDIDVVVLLTDLIDDIKIIGKLVNIKKYL